jgi:DNA-binding NarL/FixJ family response regulator
MRLITRKCVWGTTQLGDIRLAGFARKSLVPIGRQKIGVLVIDDHAGMREGIAAVVNAQADMIFLGEASDGKEAIQQFRKLCPEICLLDWNLPMVSGEEVLSTVRIQFPEAGFIVISALSKDNSVRRALCAGAQA